ncbi:hypothetical protein GTW78_25460 [Streptomyces sp. SID4948]|nr:hypothetical protein [Streptomyces sp. SID4948]
MADPFLLGALRRGKRVEEFLGPVGGGEVPGVRYVEVRPAGQNFEVILHIVEDVGHATFMDLVEFPALNSEDDEEEFGRVIATADDPPTALATAERRSGAVRERWVNEGIVQAEYADFVQAGRPSNSSPDGYPWPVWSVT